jgi:dihydropteroate synthase
MREAVANGAAIVNDVNALQGEGAMAAAAELNVPVCLMHRQGQPRSMQRDPQYGDVTADVSTFLAERVAQCVSAGIAEDRIIVDPGFGFGKTHAHNVELLANLRQLEVLGKPILVGLSRKSTLGELTGRDIDDRVAASVAAAVVAVMHGAQIVRAHDVRETYDALQIAGAVLDSIL